MSGVRGTSVFTYSADLVDAYALPESPSVASCNAMVIELCALSEVMGLQVSTVGIAGVRPNFVTARAADGREVQLLNTMVGASSGLPQVGGSLRGSLRAALARPATDANAQLQLALVQCAREIRNNQRPAAAATTGAGAVQLALLVTGVVVAGIVLLYVVQRVTALVESDRVRHSAIAAAAAERAEENDQAARTGVRPPVGPLQQAAAAAITSAAAAARSDSFGDALREVGSGLATAFKWGVGGLVVIAALSGARRSRNG